MCSSNESAVKQKLAQEIFRYEKENRSAELRKAALFASDGSVFSIFSGLLSLVTI
jgi:hypothetical protein